MPTTKKKVRSAAPKAPSESTLDAVVARLKRMGSKTVKAGMARYAIPADKALGISVGELRKLAKNLGRSHDLAAALWQTDIYEARMLATFVDDPKLVTAAQMDDWCRGFDNWAICDTACFHLFDKTPHAFAKVKKWSTRSAEFEKRSAFALLASVALHDKQAEDAPFLKCLPLIERAANDERNFVKKGVSWALRGIGARPSPELKRAAAVLAEKLADSKDAPTRWVGKDALREFAKKKSR